LIQRRKVRQKTQIELREKQNGRMTWGGVEREKEEREKKKERQSKKEREKENDRKTKRKKTNQEK